MSPRRQLPARRRLRFGTATMGCAAFEARGAAIRSARPELPDGLRSDARTPTTSRCSSIPRERPDRRKASCSRTTTSPSTRRSRSRCGFEGIGEGADVLSVLPYSHIYEHTRHLHLSLAKARYFICHDPGELLARPARRPAGRDDLRSAHLRPRARRRERPSAGGRRAEGAARPVGACGRP